MQDIPHEAEQSIQHKVTLNDILTHEDIEEVNARIAHHIEDFNREYSLDAWDYAIAGTCGLVAGMLDVLCVKVSRLVQLIRA